MAKSALPAIYVKEAAEKERLYLLGNDRTPTGNPTFASTSSGVTYDVATYGGGAYVNQGENGLLLILQGVLTNYEISATEYNAIETGVNEAKWYVVTTNIGDAFSATLSPVPSAYTSGMRVIVKFNASPTGAATINFNGLGAKAIKLTDGTDASLEASVYTLVYDGTNFILQGSGEVRRDGDNASLSSSVSGTTLKLVAPKGIYDGIDDTVTITDADFVAGNIISGIDVFGVIGTGTPINNTQSGSVSWSSTALTLDATITAVDTSKSIIFYSDPAGTEKGKSYPSFVDSTTIRFTRQNGETTSGTFYYTVIEYNNVKQKITGSNSGTNATATIATVNPQKCIVVASRTSTDPGIGGQFLFGYVSGSTTLTLVPYYNSSLYTNYWQIIEFN